MAMPSTGRTGDKKSRKKEKELVYHENVEEQAENLFEGVVQLSELFYFFGGTVALLVLLSSVMYERPTAESQEVIEEAYTEWCDKWLDHCAPLLDEAATPNLLCVMYDDNMRNLQDSLPPYRNDYLALALDGANASIPTHFQPDNNVMVGADVLEQVLTCPDLNEFQPWTEKDPLTAAGCHFNQGFLEQLVSFTDLTPDTEQQRDRCVARVNWLTNLAWTYQLSYGICNFPRFIQLFVVSAVLIILFIALSYSITSFGRTAALNTRYLLVATGIKLGLEVLGNLCTIIIGLGGLAQGTHYAVCFKGAQRTITVFFSSVVFAVGVWSILLQIRCMVSVRLLASKLWANTQWHAEERRRSSIVAMMDAIATLPKEYPKDSKDDLELDGLDSEERASAAAASTADSSAELPQE